MAKSVAKETRKPRVNTEDRVMEGVATAATWADRNRRLVVIGVVAVAAVGLAGWAWLDYRGKVTERAAVRLEEIRMSSATGAPAEQVRAELAEYVAQFGGTPFGNEARLYLAQIALEDRDYETAIRTLAPAAKLSAGTPVAFRAARSLAVAEEMRGDPEAAIAWYDRIADAALFGFQGREARSEKARILAQGGDLAAAAAIYRELREEASAAGDADEAAVWSVRLGEIEARHAAGEPPPPVPEERTVAPGSGAPPREGPVGSDPSEVSEDAGPVPSGNPAREADGGA
jgi:predicted negative regulator of RcsB-dependent stress response